MEEFRNNEEKLEEKNEIEQQSEIELAEQENPVVNIEEKKVFLNRKPKRKNRFMPYIATGVVSAMVGGLIMVGAAFYILPKTNLLNSDKSITSVAGITSIADSKAGYITATSNKDLSIVEIAKKVSPAVVGISGTISGSTDPFGFSTGSGESQGTGIIFSEDGYIVTNYHVIQGATNIVVTLNNGKEVKAKVVNYDATNDLAVIKITDKTDIPGVAEFGDSDKLQVGELAVAIGDPTGKELQGSVTVGVVSALNRQISVDGSDKHTYIQTDAAINPGNSGGPLLNSKGQVIGINSAKEGGNGLEGLGFAIPINLVKPKIDGLTKPLLKIGISGIEVTSAMATQYKLPVGIYVKDIESFSAAERCGVQSGDVIIKFDGESVKTVSDLNRIKAKHKIGDTVKIEIVRNGANKTLNLKFEDN